MTTIMLRNNSSFSLLKRIYPSQYRCSKLSAYMYLSTSSAVFAARAQGAKPKGQAPTSSKRPVEDTHLEQNPHLKHKKASGKGDDTSPAHSNAAESPKLPSQKFDGGKKGKGKRGLHWSAAALFASEGDKSAHSADSYFKDVDTNEPSTTTTYTVGGDDATNAHRPNEQYADPKKQYATVSKDEPYQPQTADADGNVENTTSAKESNLRYGGTHRNSERGTSHSKESATEGSAGGRKPEGRE